MADGNKKISFGFSKLKKPTNLVKPVVIEKQEVEFVDSFDGAKGKFSYKGTVRDQPVKKDLVIPLLGTKTALEVIKARLEERKKAEALEEEKPNGSEINSNGNESEAKIVIKQEPEPEVDSKELTIEELAAKEILTEATGNHVEEEVSSTMVIPAKQESKPSFVGEKEPTLDDYESIPVTEYGLAMLRGMGWKPDPKKGKNQIDDTIEPPKLRPKGLGLGADKVVAKPAEGDEELTIAVKSYVKFVSGHNFGKYGQVEAVDGDTNRVVVKLALGGEIVSVSELILTPVTKKDYEKNSKIINSAKYEKYKELSEKVKAEKEKETSEKKSDREKSSSSSNSHRKEKYERSRDRERRETSHSGEDSDTEKYKKEHRHKSSNSRSKHRDSDSSSEDRERKYKKKSAKDKSRSNSRERRHKKKKKKKYSSDSDSDRQSRRREHKKSSRR